MATSKLLKQKWDDLEICVVVNVDTFWVKEKFSSSSESHRQFYLFEEQLNTTFNKKLKNSKPNAFIPVEGEAVIAKDKGKWYRAVIQEKLGSPGGRNMPEEAIVFIVDYGHLLKIKAPNICLIDPGDYQSVPRQTKKIVMSGVTPISLDFALISDLTLSLQKCKKWDNAARKFVEKLKNAASGVNFECLTQSDNVSYGHLYFKMNLGFSRIVKEMWKVGEFDSTADEMSLADILVGCRFAQKDDGSDTTKGYETDKQFGKINGSNPEQRSSRNSNSKKRNQNAHPHNNNLNENFNNYIKPMNKCKTAQRLDNTSNASRMLPNKSNNFNYKKHSSHQKSPIINSDQEYCGFSDTSSVRSDNMTLPNPPLLSLPLSSPLIYRDNTEWKNSHNGLRHKLDLESEFAQNSPIVSGYFGSMPNNQYPRPSPVKQMSKNDIGNSKTESDLASNSLHSMGKTNSSLKKISSASVYSDDIFCSTKAVQVHSWRESLSEFFSEMTNSNSSDEKSDSPSKPRRFSRQDILSLISDSEDCRSVYSNGLDAVKTSTYDERNKMSISSCSSKNGSNRSNQINESSIASYENVSFGNSFSRSPNKAKEKNQVNETQTDHFHSQNDIKNTSNPTSSSQFSSTSKAFKSSHSIKSIYNLSLGLDPSETHPVYCSGDLPLSSFQLIPDEKRLKMCFNDIICNQLMKSSFFIARLQKYIWPTIVRGRSCFVVAGHSCGKTMGFIVPILSTLLNHLPLFRNKNVVNLEPSAIFICSGWQKVKDVNDVIKSLVPVNSLKSVEAWFGTGQNDEEEALKIKLFCGSDILVTTVPVILRLIQKTENSVQCDFLNKCSYLVFDDIELMLQKFGDEVAFILEDWLKFTKETKQRLVRQLIMTSSVWSKDIATLLPVTNYLCPNVIISTHMEAAIAVKVPTLLYHVKSQEDSISAMLELVQDLKEERIIIFTYEEDYVNRIKELFEAIAISSRSITSNDYMHNIREIITEFKDLVCSTLIVCDNPNNPLVSYNLHCADVIIHLGVPPTRSELGNRYSLMSDHYSPNFTESPTSVVSHLILWDQNMIENVYVFDELKRLSVTLPEKVKSVEQYALKQDFDAKINPICYYVKTLGECTNPACKWRHYLISSDVADTLPISGEVTLDIVSVINASLYLARLVFYAENGNRVDLEKFYKIIFLQLQDYYGFSSNRVPLKVAEKGKICAVFEKNIWSRAKVISVDYSKIKAKVACVLIDEGNQIEKNLDQFYKLPDHLQQMPQLIVELYLCNVQPFDKDPHWTENATDFIRDILAVNKDVTTIVGKVVFSLRNSLWLKPLKRRKNIGNKTVDLESIRSILLSHKFGINKGNHLNLLLEMRNNNPIFNSDQTDTFEWLENYEVAFSSMMDSASSSGLSSRASDISNQDSLDRDFDSSEIGSNHLEKSSQIASQSEENSSKIVKEELPLNQTVPVCIGQVINPLHFYVIKKENVDKIKETEDEIQELAMGSDTCVPFLNEMCLVKLKDGRFYRGRVDTLQYSNVIVLLMDHGKPMFASKDMIYPCSPWIIDMMPVQCIRCEIGYLSISENLLGKSAELMREILNSSSDLQVIAMGRKMYENELSYVVDLIDTSTVPYQPIWTKLLNAGIGISHKMISNLYVDKSQNSELREDNFDTRSVDSDRTIGGCEETEDVEIASLSKENVSKLLGDYNTNKVFEATHSEINDDYEIRSDQPGIETSSKSPIRLKHVTYDAPSKSFVRSKTPAIPEAEKPLSNVKLSVSIPPIKDIDPSLIRHPETFWKQDENKVNIRFSLSDVDDYACRFTKSSLIFTALYKGFYYIFNDTLYGNIKPDLCQFNVMGAAFTVTLVKKKTAKWPRLLWKIEKCPWLRPDLLNIDDSSVTTDDRSMSVRSTRRSAGNPRRQGGFPAGFVDTDATSVSLSSSEYSEDIFKFG